MADPSPSVGIAPRWRKLLRDTRLNLARSSLVVFAVVVAMTAAGALLDAWALVRRVTIETYDASHPAAATLRVTSAPDDATLNALRALPEIAAVRRRGRAFGAAVINGTRQTLELFALEDFAAREIAAVGADRGTWPPRAGEIAIEHSALDFAGIDLGDTLEVKIGEAAPQRLAVTGVARDVGLPPGWMDHVVYAFVTPATLAALGAPAANEVQFTLRTRSDRAAVRGIAAQAQALLEARGVHVAAVDVPPPGEHPHAAQMDSLMLTQGAFGLLTLLVASFLIVNLITALLARETRQIAVMKALGASTRQIAGIYLAFALLLGAIASVISLPLSLALARPYAAMKADMLNFTSAGFSVPWWALALQLAVGALLPVAAAAWPVLRACRVPVAAALRDPGMAAAHGAYVARRIALPGLGRPATLSIANAFRRRQRTLLTLLALAAGGAVFLGAANLRGSINASVDAMFATQRYDVLLRLAEPQPAHALRAAALEVDGVAGAETGRTASAAVLHDDGTRGEAFTLLGLPPDTPLLKPAVAQGRWLARDDTRALVVGMRLRREEPQLQPGAEVMLDVGGRRAAWRVVGVDETSIQSLAYAPFDALAAGDGDTRANLVAVALHARGGTAPLDAILALRSAFDAHGWRVAGSQSLAESRRSIEDHLLMVGQFLGAMGWIMIAVGGMGLASSMSLAVLERRRELGVMRAIGAPHGALLRMVALESAVIALLAWLVSLPLSLPMSLWLADAFGRVMFPVPAQLVPSVAALGAWLSLALGVALAASAWPARRALALRPAQALAYE